MTRSFFITGTDTAVGKTLAACALLQAAARAGYRAAGYKPVASGCEITPEGPRNCDALALMANGNMLLAYNQVNPLAFIEATSPHLASQDEGRSITIADLSAGLRVLETAADWLVIEGAGGWFTPLGKNLSYADWVISEKLPVILVVGIKIGCINHALLNARAVHQAGLPLVGWIASHLSAATHRSEDYLTALRDRLQEPLLGEIPWLSARGNKPLLAHYLDFSLLEAYHKD
ncbi:dethiobiotin synthase [secondary endosymbiont of Ctenarytaina eucalypti]|uniref:ATP-dependent dethiobiotin synthetase BioD n=1 Tax=secondary endosymbiont of Ctenarytaina eucalypti TaxID=1199245 RepID=J3VRB5_9ENTR|nr:dethiobiotin synthase [secondary endosymbiont of Ctenarytaina eucalypti]AFP84486.1 dethiobiotin synthase [secondary endosymbiont of Ctenarytaina eucalypti]